MKKMTSLTELIFDQPTRVTSAFPQTYTHRGFFESTADEVVYDNGVRVDITLTKEQMESLQVGQDIPISVEQARMSGSDALMDTVLQKASVTLSEFDPSFVEFKVEVRGLGEMISTARLSQLLAPRHKSSLALA
ncbi:hypothetical protein CL689_06715 [Candidatus Saccharibacteria bacterium]|nr:hypothetical protein [Candidatus Saccharibacteria bacterium]|tara:strand:- start:2720 stop:3121 length:402 start_codon:yes stop_codon:yes gene_type:complete